MARDPIDKKQIPILWGKAAGCCELCSVPVYEEGLLRQDGNYSNIAHISAASENGPRYDPDQSVEERGSIDNLMLVCRNCHKLIDDNPDDFPTVDLITKKKEQEDAVASLMQGLKPEQCTVLKYIVPFGGHAFSISDAEWKRALFSRRLGHKGLRAFDLNESKLEAGEASMFSSLADHLEKRISAFRECVYEEGPIAVFALAPQPLLVKLGAFLGDETELIVFQRSRSSDGWCGSSTADLPAFRLKKASHAKFEVDGNVEATILLSVSGTINSYSLPPEINIGQMPVYEITCSNPSVDAGDSREAAEVFRSFAADAIYQIHQECPEVSSLHVFPAMPASLNVVFGAALNTNVIPEYVVYEKRDGKFSKSLVIGGTK